MGFGENLHKELEFQDIQIKELAQKTGISKNTLDKYLSGKMVQPSVENAVKIAESLGVSVEYLVKGSNTSSKDMEKLIPHEISKILEDYKELNEFNKQTVKDLMKSLLTRQ